MPAASGTAIQAIVTREQSLHDMNPALGSQHSDLHHRYAVIHLANGKAKTCEFGHFDPHAQTGTIRIKDGAQTIHAMVDALEFDTSPESAYDWNSCEKWILEKSGFQNTKWTRDHHGITFIDALIAHLKENTKRPAAAQHQTSEHALQFKAPDANAVAVFDAVKGDVLEKIQELHRKDAVHHTHMTRDAHVEAYKLVQYGVVEVSFGWQYFGKIFLGGIYYVHARAHKFHKGGVEFHSVYITRDSCIMSRDAPLTYFEG